MKKFKRGLQFFLIVFGSCLFILDITTYLLLNKANVTFEYGAEPKVMAAALLVISGWWMISVWNWIKQTVKEIEYEND